MQNVDSSTRVRRKFLAAAATALVFAIVVLTLRFRSDAVQTSTAESMQLPSELRERVDQLKQDVAEKPTTAETLKARTAVLWDWANAYARQGGTLPVELPLTVGLVNGFPAGRGGPAAWSRTIDRYVRELQVRDEYPEAIGELDSDASKPFEAGSYQTIRQTYTVGRMPMVPGGGILVAKHFLADHPPFQTDDPAADNYVSVQSSNPNARFKVDATPLSGMHGGFFIPADALVFRLVGPTLQSGDTVTITYGDKAGGCKGFQVQTYSNERFPLPLYVDLEGKGNFFTLPIVPYQVAGKQVHSVHGFVPSIAKVDEEFELSVRSQDIYYNRASGPIPAYDVLVDGETIRKIPAGDDAITVLSDLKFSEPGVYRISFRSEGGNVTGSANPIWVQENPERRLYWGETHGHCGFAEGQGTPDAYFRFGRDEARLDFLTHSEHDLWMDDSEWEVLRENVAKYNEEGKFIALLGYEWTMRASQGGHHNVFFRTPDRNRVPIQEAPILSELYQRLGTENDEDDVLIIPHAHEPGDYRYSHPRMEPLVEIMSMHGRHEWFGQAYLSRGHQVGFVAASDDHLSHPGYVSPTTRGLADSGGLAAVWAPEKTTDALFDALKSRHAYATTGDRIIVDFRLNGSAMGQRLDYTPERKVQIRVIGTAPLESVTVVKNGQDVWTKDFVSEKDAGDRRFAKLTFASPSDPVIRDSPRAWRPWHGELEIVGARLKNVVSHSFYNPRSESLEPVAGDHNRMRFRALTRGSEKSVVLELVNFETGRGGIVVTLEPTVERYSTPSPIRRAAQLPGQEIKLSFKDAQMGEAVEELHVGRHTDTVSLRLINPDAPDEVTLEYDDVHSPDHGDYYYVRVRQLNGGMAWSSPIWVGGYPPR